MSRLLSQRYLTSITGYHNMERFMVTLVLGLILTQFELTTGINLPIVRYIIYAIALLFFLIGIYQTYSTYNYRGILIVLLLIILLISMVYSIVIAFPAIMSSADNYLNLKKILSGQLLLFLFPLLLLMRPHLWVIKKAFALSYKLSVLYLIFTIPFIVYFVNDFTSGAENYIRNFAAGSSILLLTFVYHSKRVKIITLITFIISLTLMILLARRNMILYFALILVFLFAIMYLSTLGQIRKSRMDFTLGFILLIPFIILMIFILNLDFTYAIERFTISANEGINYSREGVLEEFTVDFNSKPIDWWFGRGILGSFYSIMGGGRDEIGRLIFGQRQEIENGYYYLILKGGLIYVIPFTLLSVIGFFKGFFYSNNTLSKAAAAIVFINLFDLYGFGAPGLHLKYLTIWLSLGLCYSYTIRNYSDNFIKKVISIK